MDQSEKWYKFVFQVQQYLNSTYHRSVDTTPFELVAEVKMKIKEHACIRELLEEARMSFIEE